MVFDQNAFAFFLFVAMFWATHFNLISSLYSPAVLALDGLSLALYNWLWVARVPPMTNPVPELRPLGA